MRPAKQASVVLCTLGISVEGRHTLPPFYFSLDEEHAVDLASIYTGGLKRAMSVALLAVAVLFCV